MCGDVIGPATRAPFELTTWTVAQSRSPSTDRTPLCLHTLTSGETVKHAASLPHTTHFTESDEFWLMNLLWFFHVEIQSHPLPLTNDSRPLSELGSEQRLLRRRLGRRTQVAVVSWQFRDLSVSLSHIFILDIALLTSRKAQNERDAWIEQTFGVEGEASLHTQRHVRWHTRELTV